MPSDNNRNLLDRKNWPVLIGLLIIGGMLVIMMVADNSTDRLERIAQTFPSFLLLALILFIAKKVTGAIKRRKK